MIHSDSSQGKYIQDMSLFGPFQAQTLHMHYSNPILFSLILVFSCFSHGSMFLTGMSSSWYYEIAEIWFSPLSWDTPSLLRNGVKVRIHLPFQENGVRVRGTKLEPCKANKSCFIYLFVFHYFTVIWVLCVCVYMPQQVCGRRWIVGVSSVIPSCGIPSLNSGFQAWLQVHFPAEPSSLFLFIYWLWR